MKTILLASLVFSTVAHAEPAVRARIPGVTRYSQGPATPITIEIRNDSAKRITVDRLRLAGCAGKGTANLATPIVLAPNTSTRRSIAIDTIVPADVVLADCTPKDRWFHVVEVEYRVTP
jgi:hypothetical protein